MDFTFGFLLSFALSDFTLSGFFQSLRSSSSLATGLAQFEARLGAIHVPQAILSIVTLLGSIPETDESLPYFVFKAIEKLSSFGHRNQASLNANGLGRILFERLYTPTGSPVISPQTEVTMQKLLRKMLSIGAPTKDVRFMFTKVVREDSTLDGYILELLRMGIRAKWPEHFSLHGTASIDLKEDGGKGMYCPNGFSFMVSCKSSENHTFSLVIVLGFS